MTVINTVAYNNKGASAFSSYGQNADVNGGGTIISVHSAIESTSRKFSDGDDVNHIVLTQTAVPGFLKPSPIVGKGTTQSETDEINSSEYTLAEGSLCIDAGADDYANEILFDLAYNDRIMGAGIDIGAYEFKSGNSLIPGEKIKSSSLSVYVAENEIYISGAKTGTTLIIYNTQGTIVNSMKIEGEYDYIMTDLPRRGIYFVTAGDDVVKIRY